MNRLSAVWSCALGFGLLLGAQPPATAGPDGEALAQAAPVGPPPAQAGPPAAQAVQSSSPSVKDPRNFEGVWKNVPLPGQVMFMIGLDLPYKPATRAMVSRRLELTKKGTPIASAHLTCRPTGVAGALFPLFSVIIMQTPRKLIFLSEEDRDVRQVFIGGSHPAHLTPTYTGHSVAHWDGNTLVVDTIGYNGMGWIDEWGTPQSKRLHMVQRFTKSADGNTLTIVTTFDDPVYFTKPFTKTRQWQRDPMPLRLENDCAENTRPDVVEGIIYENPLFKPVCSQSVVNGVLSSKVVCKKPKADEH
jgi:hypothetical protein